MGWRQINQKSGGEGPEGATDDSTKKNNRERNREWKREKERKIKKEENPISDAVVESLKSHLYSLSFAWRRSKLQAFLFVPKRGHSGTVLFLERSFLERAMVPKLSCFSSRSKLFLPPN